MIGKLTGAVDSVGDEWAIVDVNGVGYVVFCSRRTLTNLPSPGETARLLIETHVREDHIHLYGFADAAERTWFRLLCTVQGVGARMALAVLSVLPAEELAQAIAAQDKAAHPRQRCRRQAGHADHRRVEGESWQDRLRTDCRRGEPQWFRGGARGRGIGPGQFGLPEGRGVRRGGACGANFRHRRAA